MACYSAYDYDDEIESKEHDKVLADVLGLEESIDLTGTSSTAQATGSEGLPRPRLSSPASRRTRTSPAHGKRKAGASHLPLKKRKSEQEKQSLGVPSTISLGDSCFQLHPASVTSLDLQLQPASVTSLDLLGRGIDRDSARALAEALERIGSLTTLNLRGNAIGEDGARALAEALKDNGSLTTLDLRGNAIGDDGARALAEALEHNDSLTTLYLGGNAIGEDGARALAKALEHTGSLTTLDLSGNAIGEDGARALAKALEHNGSLTTLDLFYSAIGEDGARALAKALEHNGSLTTLDLSFNCVSADMQAISLLVAKNKTRVDPACRLQQDDDCNTMLAASPTSKHTISLPLTTVDVVDNATEYPRTATALAMEEEVLECMLQAEQPDTADSTANREGLVAVSKSEHGVGGAPSLAQLAQKSASDAVEHLCSQYPATFDWSSSTLQFSLALQVLEHLASKGLAFYVPRFHLQENGRPLPITEPLGFAAISQDETVAAFSQWLSASYAERHQLHALLDDVDKEQRLIDAEGLTDIPGFVGLSKEFFAQAAGSDIGGGPWGLPSSGTSSNRSRGHRKPQELGQADDEEEDYEDEEQSKNGATKGEERERHGIPFKTYALLVGIQKTNDMQQLIAPYNDVAAMEAALRRLFGEDNIVFRTVTDEGTGELVKRKKLLFEFEAAQEWFKGRQNGQFLFFYSGHATSVEGNLYGRLLPSNVASSDARRKGFGMEELYTTYNALQHGRQSDGDGETTRRMIPVVAIFDCCKSGVVHNSVPTGIAPMAEHGQACITMMCACAANRGALEVGSGEEELGLFTKDVLEEINRITEDNDSVWAPIAAGNISSRQYKVIARLREEGTLLANLPNAMQFATYPQALQYHLTPCFMFSDKAKASVAP